MTSAQVVEKSVTITNSSFQNYTDPVDHTRQTTDTPGFKPFTSVVFATEVLIVRLTDRDLKLCCMPVGIMDST